MQQSTPQISAKQAPASVAPTRIYFDNAATTPLEPAVLDAMLPYLSTHFGNPSSIYSYGRETRMAIEAARKSVAKNLGVRPGSIFFTSGGTESNNTAIAAAIRDLGCTHIISSRIEHHAVLHTVEHYGQKEGITTSFVALTADGEVDYDDLARQLAESSRKTLVTLMGANNEIGTLLDLHRVGELCRQYGAIFHSDCVQTVGHFRLDLSSIHIHFISAAGHKFHGPKGVGILYVNEEVSIKPFIWGGGQERNMRAGTENVYGIVGFAKALELSMENLERDSSYIRGLKDYMMSELQHAFPRVSFNQGRDTLYTVLSVCFPKNEKSDFLLFNLDINNICASGGSACSSGTDIGSHVMQALNKTSDWVTVRFSFSKYNTQAEIDTAVEKLRSFV